jgi:2-C-methyl-D-erythritol 4-phosphate cytidylyltransferase
MITAIILAGGVGSRVGADRPKQFVEVLDKPVLAYTIEIFEKHPDVDAIEVVCHKSWKDYLDEMIVKYGYKKVKWVADGGETFQDSVMSGVNNLKDKISGEDYVLIQYGAAPFTSKRIVSDVIRVMKEKDSSVTATPCYQLLGSMDGDTSNTWVDRDKYTQIACPYGFKYSYLLDVYKRAMEKGLIDVIEPHTTSLMYALGDKLNLAYGDQTNIKITTKEDLDMFEGYVLMMQRRNKLIIPIVTAREK